MIRSDRLTQVLLSALVLGIWCAVFQPVISARLATPAKGSIRYSYKTIWVNTENDFNQVNTAARSGYRVCGVASSTTSYTVIMERAQP